MMDMARDGRERLEKCKIELDKNRGDSVAERDAVAITEMIDAKDPEVWDVSDPDGDTKAASTLYQNMRNLQTAAKRTDTPLVDLDTDGVNALLRREKEERDLARNTLLTRGANFRNFYNYRIAAGYDCGVSDPSNIHMPTADKPGIDPADMFSRDEIEAMRGACRNARDRFIFDFLLYTGQRVGALRTLRIKDVFLDESRYRLNPEAEGLKGAAGRRPLLGAKNAVRDWLDKHPASDDPDAYVLTRQPMFNAEVRPYDTLSGDAVRRAIRNIGERAGITKPTHPHAFRHNFVTLAKRDYEMDNDTIKFLIGHAPDSQVMESTYSHLSDEDFNQRAEIAAGIRDPTEDSPLTPETCPTCGEPLDTSAKACGRCGTLFAPNAAAAKDQIESARSQAAADGDGVGAISNEKLSQLISENPNLITDALADASD
jgi:integrase